MPAHFAHEKREKIMAASFSVTRRFFFDKNYTRGFSRHGAYTIKK